MLRCDQILFAFLHLAPDRAQTQDLLKSGCTAIAYETIIDSSCGLPLLAPMSEVAGRLAIEAAGAGLRKYAGGRGILLGGVPGVVPARIAIIGGGVVGTHAARMAAGLGSDVTVFDISIPQLRRLDEIFQGRIRTRYPTKEAVEQELAQADVVVGAVLVPGGAAPRLISRDSVKQMKKGSVIVDVAIDQGGCAETSKPTTHANPTYLVDGVVHYCVANMPGAVPLTSSHALNNATLSFGLALANEGLQALANDVYLRAGLNIHNGHITCKPVADSLGLPYLPALESLGLAPER